MLRDALLNGVPQHIARQRLAALGADSISQNAPLMVCFIVGLPYMVYAIVMYVVHALDMKMTNDVKTATPPPGECPKCVVLVRVRKYTCGVFDINCYRHCPIKLVYIVLYTQVIAVKNYEYG